VILGRRCRTTGFQKILAAILFLGLLLHSVPAFSATVPTGQNVTLTWRPSPNTNVVGYDIYYGVASQTYTKKIDVGNVTNATILGLIPGVTYYFTATAYDSFGNQSGFSDEATYAVPAPSQIQNTAPAIPQMQIRNVYNGRFALTVNGPSGHRYQVEATQDFTTWTVIAIMTLDASGSVEFTDTDAVNYPQRFYRTEEIP